MLIQRHFTQEGQDPFTTVEWEKRTVEIKNRAGEVLFQQEDVEVPTFWSNTAANILAEKYFRKRGIDPNNAPSSFGPYTEQGGETSLKQVANRLAQCWTAWGLRSSALTAEEASIYYDEMVYMIINQMAAPNTPQWYNTGLFEVYGIRGEDQGMVFFNPQTREVELVGDSFSRPAPNACFIQKLDDNLVQENGIMDLALKEARLFKFGAGSGFDMTPIRGKGAPLSGGGVSSGLMSWVDIWDSTAGSIKSGGTNRRAATLRTLQVSHPEILEYVKWKEQEERKVAALAVGAKVCKRLLNRIMVAESLNDVRIAVQDAKEADVPDNYIRKALLLKQEGFTVFPFEQYDTDWQGEAYRTVGGQNSNNSVRVTDAFMKAVQFREDWWLGGRNYDSTDGGKVAYAAKGLWDAIMFSAWFSADPGLQMHNIINLWHTCLADGEINASNPCSEYMFLDDTACNLASKRLTKFIKVDAEGRRYFDVAAYVHATVLWTITLEISVEMSSYPSKNIAKNSYMYRTLGLGYADLGALLMSFSLPYDSDAGRAVAATITSLMTGTAYATSAKLARRLGKFERYHENEEHMLRVIDQHKAATAGNDGPFQDWPVKPHVIQQQDLPAGWFSVLEAALGAWIEARDIGDTFGFRNAQVTVLAPTGCLTSDTLVPTERGLVRLQSLGNPEGAQWQELGIQVQTDEGAKIATQFYINGVSDVVTVTTARGYQIKGTPQHRIKVVDSSGEWIWRRLAEIQPDDVVPMSMNQLVGKPQVVVLPPLPELHWNADFNTRVPRVVTPELAELLGYFMGDGSLHTKGLRFCVANGDDDVAQRLGELAMSLFGLETKLTQQQGYVEVAVNSVPLVLWWEACGFAKFKPTEEHAGKGYVAHIPDAILTSNSADVYAAFIRGLYEADGTVAQGYPAWSTKDRQFSQDIQVVLLALGYPTTRKVDTSGWGQSEINVLRLLNQSFNDEWAQQVGFMGSRKQSAIKLEAACTQAARKDYIPVVDGVVSTLSGRLKQNVQQSLRRTGGVTRRVAKEMLEATQDANLAKSLGYFYDKVATSTLGEEELTYDLSVPENVTYIANGFVSHNTIGLVMDCDTTGVEPDFALQKSKSLAGGGWVTIVNRNVKNALLNLRHAYSDAHIDEIIRYVEQHGTIEGSGLREEHLAVFDCANRCGHGTRSIRPEGHILMMAAVQPFISGAISKTVNCPEETTVAEFDRLHWLAYTEGLKSVAVYRDKSKLSQPLMTTSDSDSLATFFEAPKTEAPVVLDNKMIVLGQPEATRKELKFRRRGVVHELMVSGHKLFLTTGEYEDGSLAEIFVKMSKEGSTLGGFLDAFSVVTSLALQHGVPLQKMVDKLVMVEFEPKGFVDHPQIKMVKSIIDLIFRVLALEYLNDDQYCQIKTTDLYPPEETREEELIRERAEEGYWEEPPVVAPPALKPKVKTVVAEGPPCNNCQGLTIRTGTCYACTQCGTTTGCS